MNSPIPPGSSPFEVARCRYYLARVDALHEGIIAVTLQQQIEGLPEYLGTLDPRRHTIETGGVPLREGDLLELWTYYELHPEGPPVGRAHAVMCPRPVATEAEREELRQLLAELEAGGE